MGGYMRYVFLIVILISGCKASVDNDGTVTPSKSSNGFIAHCSKYLKVYKKEKIKSVSEPDSPKEELKENEYSFYVNYSIEKDSNENTYIKCSISDGNHEYKGEEFIPGSRAYLSKNYCDIIYDLENDKTSGTFTIEYSNDWAWIHYFDEESDYKFDVKFRNSECIQFDK